MSARHPNSGRISANDWFGYSGFRDVPFNAAQIPYARRLCRYISDPSTVRVRVLERFGSAPSLATITKLRQEWTEKAHHYTENRYLYGLKLKQRDEARLDNLTPAAAIVDEVPEPVIVVAPEVEVAPTASILPFAPIMRTGPEVIEACAFACDVTAEQIVSPSRARPIVRARYLAAAVLRARGSSYPVVGRFLSRDHTAIIHAVATFFDRDLAEPEILAAWEAMAPARVRHCRSVDELDAVLAA